MAKESFYEQMKRLGLWDKPIGELANVIDEKDKAIAEKDKEIEHLREELDWKETGGVDRITGKAWLTTRMHLEAEILELRMKLKEKDKEIERLTETTIDVWIKVPKEDSDGYTN